MALTPEGTPYVESTDLVANYPAASLSLANRVDLVGVLPFADAAARTAAIPTPTDGQFTYLQDTNTPEFYDGTSFVAIGGGKVLQVVRATDTVTRATTSTSYVDASLSVTITPQKSTSAILILWTAKLEKSVANEYLRTQITDNSDVAISGAQDSVMGSTNATGMITPQTLIAYSTPGTTSATTYKARFRSSNGNSVQLLNNGNDGQLYAIEVSA